jgi:hypothetical protein
MSSSMLSGPPALPRGAVCAAWMTCSTVMMSLGSPSGRGCYCPESRCVRLRAGGCRLRRCSRPLSFTALLIYQREEGTSVVFRIAVVFRENLTQT